MEKNIFSPAKVMLPKDCDMSKWSVVACDQYTSEPKYWENVKSYVGDSPSALNLVLPEIYLNDDDVAERIEAIGKNMCDYCESVLTEYNNSYIYVEREITGGKIRHGIIGMVDLEEYDYTKGSQTAIRATEGTILERIPPRMRVRERAAVELTHILLLIDDEAKSIIEPLADKKSSFECVYDFDLMCSSGNIKGFIIPEDEAEELSEKLKKLGCIDAFNKKYGVEKENALVYAVGDGNHSLATAKACYEKIKGEIGGKALSHPARYALVEVGNLHDESLEFEPIHRVIFDVDADNFVKFLVENGAEKCDENADGQVFDIVIDGISEKYKMVSPKANITVGSVQTVIDEYLTKFGGEVDYIHGDDVVKNLSKGNNVGILFDVMEKDELFKTVILDGSLPRKTFSMGNACDKRFYTECRKIR